MEEEKSGEESIDLYQRNMPVNDEQIKSNQKQEKRKKYFSNLMMNKQDDVSFNNDMKTPSPDNKMNYSEDFIDSGDKSMNKTTDKQMLKSIMNTFSGFLQKTSTKNLLKDN